MNKDLKTIEYKHAKHLCTYFMWCWIWLALFSYSVCYAWSTLSIFNKYELILFMLCAVFNLFTLYFFSRKIKLVKDNSNKIIEYVLDCTNKEIIIKNISKLNSDHTFNEDFIKIKLYKNTNLYLKNIYDWGKADFVLPICRHICLEGEAMQITKSQYTINLPVNRKILCALKELTGVEFWIPFSAGDAPCGIESYKYLKLIREV